MDQTVTVPACCPHGNRHTWIGSSTVIALLAWGVFSLGAVRPWGYVPLIAGLMMSGIASVLICKQRGSARCGLAFSLVALCCAIGVQLVPLPVGMIHAISPSTLVVSPQTAGDALPLSINPRSTALGLAFVVALGFFFVGSVTTMESRGARQLAGGLVGLGAIVALVGIAEASNLWIGFYRAAGWPLPPDSSPHGPFASRNHYAGWMLMTLPLTMGYLCAALEKGWHARPGRVILLQCAATAMVIALVQTRSRAGILGLAIAVATMGGLLMRRNSATKVRIVIAGVMGLLLLTGISVARVQPVVSRFLVDSWFTAHGRLVLWRQAVAIARDFPVAGAGFSTYQSIVPFYPTAGLDEPYEGAHNDYLQLAAEGGMLVGLPFLSTVGFFVRETRQRFRESSSDSVTEWLRVGAVVGLALLALQETVDFSLRVPGVAALFVALAVIAVHHSDPDSVTN